MYFVVCICIVFKTCVRGIVEESLVFRHGGGTLVEEPLRYQSVLAFVLM